MKAVINLSARSPVLPKFPHYGVCILESRHTKGFEMMPSQYEFYEVMLILEGKGWVSHGRVRHPVQKGNLVIVPAQEAYFFTDSDEAPLAMYSLCVAPPEGMRSVFEGVLPQKFSVARNFPLSREVAAHLRAIFFEQSHVRAGGAAAVIGQTLLLLGKLMRRQDSSQEEEKEHSAGAEIHFLVRVRDYIAKLETTFHESETIRAVADRLGMSPRSFTHHFRAVTGVSRHQYVQKLRLRQARYLLTETDESVTSIAFACGFEDLSNFFRAFRLEERMSPSQWREIHKGNGG